MRLFLTILHWYVSIGLISWLVSCWIDIRKKHELKVGNLVDVLIWASLWPAGWLANVCDYIEHNDIKDKWRVLMNKSVYKTRTKKMKEVLYEKKVK